MSIIDICAIILIALGAIHGLIRGLSGELSHFISILAAFIFGLWGQRPFAMWLLDNTNLDEKSAQALAFIAIILTALIIFIFLQYMLKKIIQIVVEDKFDRILGAFAGLVRSIIVVIIIFIAMNLVPHDYLNMKFGEESIIGSAIKPYIPYILTKTEEITDSSSDK